MNFCDTARLCLFPRFVISFFYPSKERKLRRKKFKSLLQTPWEGFEAAATLRLLNRIKKKSEIN